MSKHTSNETFQAYLDGELGHQDQLEFEAHLGECSDCSGELEQLRSLFQSIESLPPEQLTIDLAPGVIAGVRPRIPSLAIGELVAAAVLTVGLIIWFGGMELQDRMGSAVQRLLEQVQFMSTDFSTTLNELLARVPEVGQLELTGLEELAGSVLISPSIWWIVAAAALALLLLGNGLVLRLGKGNNV